MLPSSGRGRVTGIGGIFFKTQHPEKLKTWYCDHFGFVPSSDGSVIFEWHELDDPGRQGYTVWGPFPKNTRYFEPSQAPFMINYRVENLDQLLEQLRSAGVEVDDRVEEYEYGRFAWIMDPEGNRIELWEPPETSQ
jgi:predicted enzyme related to lactoylglutathione lyase